MNFKITLLPGDGIGPEVVAEAVRVLETIASKYNHGFDFQERFMGGCSIDKYGSSLTDETLADCQSADAVLLGAVGGPKWDDPTAKDRPERGLLALRKGLGVFANLRPVKVHPALMEWSPLKPEKLQGVDILVVRELTGGLYFGFPKGRDIKDGRERAVDTLEYYDYEVRRVMTVSPTNVDAMLKHQDDAWITLVTCKGYSSFTDEYAYRTLVRAVLVDVK